MSTTVTANGSNGVLSAPSKLTEQTNDALAASELESDFNSRLVLRPWRKRFSQQWLTLCGKQLLVYKRSARATIIRLLSPLFFMFLLWLLNLAFTTNNPQLDAYLDTPTPAVDTVEPIPPCTDDAFARDPCWDFVYSPNNSAIVNSIVDGIRASNPGRPIPSTSVLGFESIEATNAWMLENPERTTGGYHFQLTPTATGGSDIGYVLQVNGTAKFFRGNFQNPTFFAGVPMQVAVEREIARYHWKQSGRPGELNWTISTSQFAHPTTGSINIVGSAIGPMVFAANLFNFIILLSSIVTEKELGLRQALTVAGMVDSAFWMSWLAVEIVISVIYSLLLIASGCIFQFEYFLDNSIGVNFVLFLLFQWAMVGFAFFLSTFISKSSTAINLGFVIFILGWIIQTVIAYGYPYQPKYIDSVPVLTVIFTLMPWSLLAKAGGDLGAAAEEGNGLQWSDISSYCQDMTNQNQIDAEIATNPNQYWDFECVLSISQIFILLLLEAILYILLALYFDNVLPNDWSTRKPLWYCLTPSYWCGGSGMSRKKRGAVRTARGVRPVRPPKTRSGADLEPEVDADVVAEEERMKELLQHRTGSADSLALEADRVNAVELFGLQKGFDVRRGCFASCKRRKDFWAIKGSWFAIERNVLTCLLGPNGAGKTTTINCLTGVLAPTGGDALIYGESLSTPGGLDRVRSVMGVCPQFDMLWGELTGKEHLMLYGKMKGLNGKNVAQEAYELLEAVKLTEAAHQRTSAYSGGMRRRLSVAIALLGDPLIVYLDEPTTGMDPISRRHVWEIVEKCKSGRAVVLTTHSMEEADILGDKIVIMARGRVRAVGTSLRLKQRFGAGYQLSVSTANPGPRGEPASHDLISQRAARVKQFFKKRLAVGPSGETGAYLHFLVPKQREADLPDVLRELEEGPDAADYGVSDVQIGLTTLEEVFLNIARQAEVEAAEAEGRPFASVPLESGTVLKVPLGEEYATDEATSIKYHIKWAQDDNGSLQVLRWIPVDPTTNQDEEESTATTVGNTSTAVNGGVSSNGVVAVNGGGSGRSIAQIVPEQNEVAPDTEAMNRSGK